MNENIEATAPASGAPDLPPLPLGDYGTFHSRHEGGVERYSADQMTAYARAALAQAAPASPPAAADAGALSYEDAFNAAWAETSKLNRISPGAPPSPKFIEWFRAGWDARPTASGATITDAPASPASAPVAPTETEAELLRSHLEDAKDLIQKMMKQETAPYGYVWFDKNMEHRFTRGYPHEFYNPADIKPVFERAPLAVKVEAQQAGVVEGWKLVPVEPTDAMREACPCHEYYADIDADWAAMLAAATLPPVVARKVLTDAANDVLAERERQVIVEGWQHYHDDAHAEGDLVAAAVCYAAYGQKRWPELAGLWPWSTEWWKPKDQRRNLVKSAALLLAEIERMDRDAARLPGTNGSGVE